MIVGGQSVAFDRAAEYYDETRGFPPGKEAEVGALLQSTGGLNSQSRVLEVGIGTGRIALPLARHVDAVFGVDLARPMMGRLRAKQRGERVFLVEGDVTRLPFGDNTFDAVVAVHVFHLIPAWPEAVAETGRVLKPGAPLLSAWSENFHKDSWWQAWDRAMPANKPLRRGLQHEQYRSFLLDMGWAAIGEERKLTYAHQQTPNAFLDQFRKRTWSSTWDLTDDELAAGVESVRQTMLNEQAVLDAPVTVETGFFVRAYTPPK